MKLPRRKFLHLATAAAALPTVSRIASAQAYPTRPVRLIVPVAPAGASDITARLIGQWLSERLGQPFIIENRPGGGNSIGTEAVVRAPADGLGLVELAVVLYVLNAIKDRETSLIVSVLGLIYATIRVLALNLAHTFMLLGRGLEQRFYELERHWDPQKQQPETDPPIGQLYWDAFISWVFVAMVYLICLLNLFSRL